MKVIGLTGNIGSGKSLVSAFMNEFGAAVIDADKVGHDIIEPNGPAYPKIVSAFGRDFLLPDGHTDRKAIAQFVFGEQSGERVKILNQITHPLITESIRTMLKQYAEKGYSVAVIEAALLFDSDIITLTDENWVVDAPEDVLVARAAKRDDCDAEMIRARLRKQRRGDDLRTLADRIILNDGSVESLKEKVKREFHRIGD